MKLLCDTCCLNFPCRILSYTIRDLSTLSNGSRCISFSIRDWKSLRLSLHKVFNISKFHSILSSAVEWLWYTKLSLARSRKSSRRTWRWGRGCRRRNETQVLVHALWQTSSGTTSSIMTVKLNDKPCYKFEPFDSCILSQAKKATMKTVRN